MSERDLVKTQIKVARKNGIEFVKRFGNDAEQHRLHLILSTNESPQSIKHLEARQRVIAGFESRQRPDGGFEPFWAPGNSGLDASCYQLAQAEQMQLVDTPFFQRTVEFFINHQRDDGMWQENEILADLAPPWLKPRDLSTQLYLTANCGYWVSLTRPNADSAMRSAAILESHLSPTDPEKGLPSYPHTNWLALGIGIRLNRPSLIDSCTQHLNTGIDSFSANQLSWMGTTLLSVIPAAQTINITAELPIMSRIQKKLISQQRRDGGWSSDDEMTRDVHVTLEALRILAIF